jgi:hypothetical protein
MASSKKKDDLLAATQTVFNALKELAPELQSRVLSSALSLLGISQPEAQSAATRAC